MKFNDAYYSPKQARLDIRSFGTQVWNAYGRKTKKTNCAQITAAGFAIYVKKQKKNPQI